MNSRPSQRTNPQYTKVVLTTTLTLLGIFMVLFIPPQSLISVMGFILLITVLAYLASSFFLRQKYQILIAAFIGLFLLINYLVGFQLLNTALLLSFIIGLTLLIQ